jgi:hypothetical protein
MNMKLVRRFAATLLALPLLVSCGSGADAGKSVFDNSDGTTPSAVASDLIVEVDKVVLSNTGTDTATIKATVLDANRNVIKGATVLVTVDSEAIVTTANPVSGDCGCVTSAVTIGANRTNRLLTVNVSTGGLSKQLQVQVVGATLSGTAVPVIVPPGGTARVNFRLEDRLKISMPGQAIEVAAAGFTPSVATGTTGANGEFAFTYTAPTVPGAYTITATAAGTSLNPGLIIQVQNTQAVDPASGVVTSASVSANPSVVATNAADSTTNRTQIRALFVGANNQPIERVRVRFDLGGDLNSIGGTFESGNTTLLSDANGIVTTSYIPGSRSSPTDGVTVRACYGTTDSDPNLTSCALNARVTLTVSSEPLSVSIGTNGSIIVTPLTYEKQYVVTVVDAAGVAKPDVSITASLDLTNFRKGRYRGGPPWAKIFAIDPEVVCPNEDINRNAVLEVGEDRDRDGQLEPRKSDVSIRVLNPRTRADGTAEIRLQYAQSFGTWVDAAITVAASGVAGSEGRATYLAAPIPIEAAALDRQGEPAFLISPYGVVPDCTDRN